MEKTLILCDTDVLIDFFDVSKKRHLATSDIILKQIEIGYVLIPSISLMEILKGASNKTKIAHN